jgi:hypothetical protein
LTLCLLLLTTAGAAAQKSKSGDASLAQKCFAFAQMRAPGEQRKQEVIRTKCMTGKVGPGLKAGQ